MSRHIARHILFAATCLAGALVTIEATQETPRETWQRTGDIFAALGAAPGANIADVGAGNGYFTTRLAKVVGDGGLVHAVDVDASSLRRLRSRLETDAITNVRVIEGAVDDPRLPEGTIDGALIINAYHEMDQHQEMLAGLKRALKPAGKLVIVEPITERYRDASRADQTRRHEIAAHFVLEDLRQAGFRVLRYEEEFTRRPGGDTEWIIVASPGPARTTVAAQDPAASEDWLSPALRIDIETARLLFESGKALFVDVRNHEMFEEGRIAGSRLVPMRRLDGAAAELAQSGKRVITFCS